jgi:predicted nucleotidyltransferase
MIMVAMREIRAFSDAIAREFHPHQIILFGSHARGKATKDSDVDLLVIMPHTGHPVEKAIEIRQKVSRKFALDLLVRSPAELRRRLSMGDSFIHEITQQGKVLYEGRDARMVGKGRGRSPQRRTRNAGAKVAKL